MSNTISNLSKKIILTLAVILGLFHLYTAYFGVFPGQIQRSVHWMLISIIIFLMPLTLKDKKQGHGHVLVNITLVILAIATGLYLIINYETVMLRYGNFNSLDLILGIVAVFLLLEATRRTLGWALPIITLLFIAYAFLGRYIPGLLGHNGVDFKRFFTFMYLTSDGIYGLALGVSATFIFLFILFGSFLSLTGAGNFFVNVALAGTGTYKGGPALAAVTSSALMGTISGSGVANVVTTGTFTIPLMKKTGYKPHFAGAVEAVASNGGQIMPPIMGAVAFLMAELLGIRYIDIAIAAVIPAILYFVTIAFAVYLEAKKENMSVLTKEELPNLRETIKDGYVYLIPLIIIVYLLFKGYSPMRAAFFAILAIVIIGIIKKSIVFKLSTIVDSMYDAAKSSLSVAAACACAGIIIGVVSLTGLGLKLSTLIITLSNDVVIIALVLTMLVSLVLGMGLPTSAAYLILAVLGGPALIKMGVDPMPAHLFILYFGCLSTITPPVALSAFAAAGIAGSPPMKTGMTSFRLAIVAFIIPFMFVYSPALLMQGTLVDILITTGTAIFGCYLVSASIIGYMSGKIGFITRTILFIAALFMLHPGTFTDLIGIIVFILIFVWRNFNKHKEQANLFTEN